MIVAFVLLLGLVSYDALFPQWPSGLVSPDDMKNYATSYISEYQTLFSAYNGIIFSHNYQNHFIFGFGAPNAITSVVSLERGAMITFNSSSSSSFEAESSLVDTPVEYQLWPQMPSNPYESGIKPVVIENGTYVLTAPVTDQVVAAVVEPGAILWYNGTGNALRLSGNGSVVILGSLIYPGKMILKGSNAPASWSTLQARFDALDEFLQDGKPIFNTSTVQSIQSLYRVPLLLTLMGNRIADGSYHNNPNLFTSDFAELSKYATNATLQQIQNSYLSSQEVQPSTSWTPFFTAIENPAFLAIVASPILAVVVGLVLAKITGKWGGSGETSRRKTLIMNWQLRRLSASALTDVSQILLGFPLDWHVQPQEAADCLGELVRDHYVEQQPARLPYLTAKGLALVKKRKLQKNIVGLVIAGLLGVITYGISAISIQGWTAAAIAFIVAGAGYWLISRFAPIP